MRFHILNGDALAEKFRPNDPSDQVIVIGEAFVEGPVSIHFTEDYWKERAEFVAKSYDADADEYERQVLSELKKLGQISDTDEVFLWFEDDLFCITNMLFSIFYISQKSTPKFYRVFPKVDNQQWSGFGWADQKELQSYFEYAQQMPAEDVELSKQLWEAFVLNDRERLKALSFSETQSFHFLPEVIQAHLDRSPRENLLGRPHQALVNILDQGITDFYKIYEAFWKQEGIYGFGDAQVYNMLKEIESEGVRE